MSFTLIIDEKPIALVQMGQDSLDFIAESLEKAEPRDEFTREWRQFAERCRSDTEAKLKEERGE